MSHPARDPQSPVRTAATVVAVIATLQALMVLAFAWPAAHTAPRDVPIVVTGPAQPVQEVSRAIDGAVPGGFDIDVVEDEQAARSALEDRQAYGAVVISEEGPRVLVASAASASVAQVLTSLSQALGPDAPASAPVEDVVALTDDDPRGAVLSAGLLPLVMTGVVAGALLAVLVRPVRVRAAAVLAFAALGGTAVGTIDHVVLGGLAGPLVLESGVIALTILAITSTVAGLASAVGRPGIPISALVMMLVGNPLSGAASAPELLPQPWGALGQLLPPGAGATALRGVAFFGGAGAAAPLMILSLWSALGLALLGLALRRERRGGLTGGPVDEPAVPAETGSRPVPVAG